MKMPGDHPSATTPFLLLAGLLTEVHPARTPSRPKPVASMRTVPITALGTSRNFTAFPILPRSNRHAGTTSDQSMLHNSDDGANCLAHFEPLVPFSLSTAQREFRAVSSATLSDVQLRPM